MDFDFDSDYELIPMSLSHQTQIKLLKQIRMRKKSKFRFFKVCAPFLMWICPVFAPFSSVDSPFWEFRNGIPVPGTTIYSDRAAMYVNNNAGIDPQPSHITRLIRVKPPYIHESVNHKENFVDPTSGAWTNWVELCITENAKMKMKAMSGTSREKPPHIWMNSNGDNFMARRRLKLLTTYSSKYLYFTLLTIKTTRRVDYLMIYTCYNVLSNIYYNFFTIVKVDIFVVK